MNKVKTTFNAAISTVIRIARGVFLWIDTQISQEIPFWGQTSWVLKSIILLLIGDIMVHAVCALLSMSGIVVQTLYPCFQALGLAFAIIFFVVYVCRNALRFLLSIVLLIVLMLLLKHITTMYGVDASAIDTVLKGIANIPQMICQVLTWLKEGPSTLA